MAEPLKKRLKALKEAEKLTLKLFIDGKEACEIDMGNPQPDPVYKERLVWAIRTDLVEIPCKPYEIKDGTMISYYYPYHFMVRIGRNLNKVIL